MRVGVGAARRGRRRVRLAHLGFASAAVGSTVQRHDERPAGCALHELAAARLPFELAVVHDHLAAREHHRGRARDHAALVGVVVDAHVVRRRPRASPASSGPTPPGRRPSPRRSCPCCGHRPNIFAGFVETSSTKRCMSMRPARTPPSQTSISRVSMPGAPFGIFEKSSLPSCFCGGSFMQNGQWSVETTCRSFLAQPLPERVLVPLLAQRRRHHVLGALEARAARSRRRRGTGTAGRSRRRRAGPCRAPASPSRARPSTRGGRCRSGTPAISASAIARPVASPSARVGPRERVVLGRLLAPAQRLLHQRVDDAAVLGVHADEPAVLARLAAAPGRWWRRPP